MERIHVSVRARPLSAEDEKTSPWRISGNSIFIPNHPSKFEFDWIFREDCKTVDVYQARTRDIVAAAVRGFNGTVFAYGQTNSGKTHTMRGSPVEPGVIPLAVHDLFDIIHQDTDREFLLRMSYLEIYNEDINDLLAPEHRKLQIHESIERGIYVAGLREEIVASPQQVLELMEFGESHRHIGETNMNLYSSRSHTIFRMVIESREKTEDADSGNACDAVRVSVLNLVDLAGSERAAKTGAEGVRLKEGSHINKSLMTLGTVIKKLSEGAESQGGHVPYRDSKLTRILQPALGGNANTAIICNITLAQIHADETKSSLQFASRALRVTNCARVNEILTDAALLKRQKKEIEELRAKLQGSHSEHLEEEILNLRNILLKSELERERIALELEEEKKAQAQREKVLQEQAKKIENLSSMVLYSNRDEKCDHFKKEKRRDTWCPGNLSRDSLIEVQSSVLLRHSTLNSGRTERDTGPLLPFEDLVNENGVEDEARKQEDDSKDNAYEGSALPNPCALLHVTNRRRVPVRKRTSSLGDNDLAQMQMEYEDLLLKYETERTVSEIQIECLKRKLDEAGLFHDTNTQSEYHVNRNMICGDTNASLRDSEAILVIKQLQEKIKMLEMEKFSTQKNLDNLVEIATEQSICAREKLAELQEEILIAKEEARMASEQLVSEESARRIDLEEEILIAKEEARMAREQLVSEESVRRIDVEELISGVQTSKVSAESISSLVDEVLQDFSNFSNLLHEFTSFMHQSAVQQASIFSCHEKIQFSMKQKVLELENQKLLLQDESAGLLNQIEELRLEAQNHEASLMTLGEQHDLETSELLSHIQSLEKEISSLSSCSLAKEKENLRKDLEKTKTKLKETESKLKNIIQDKTKLEGEKAFAERELKQLHGQKTLLERDISKRESLAGRRRDSVVGRSSKVSDPGRATSSCVHTLEDDYKKLEVLAFEMEATIASLEDELSAAYREKEEATFRNEGLAAEILTLSEKLEMSNSELNLLQKEVVNLKTRLEEAYCDQQRMETSIKALLEEKEELAMQLAKSLLEMEEEKAIWFSKEKASIEAIEERARLYNTDLESLSKGMSEVKKELESCRAECIVLADRLRCSEEDGKHAKECSAEKSLEIDRLRNYLRSVEAETKHSQEVLKSNLETLTLELQDALKKQNVLQKELNSALSERQDLLIRIKQLDNGPHESNQLQQKDVDNKEKVKLRMRLRGTQAQLDAMRHRYKQCVEESDLMNGKFEEASENLKARLASKAVEVLDLKKQLAAAKGTIS